MPKRSPLGKQHDLDDAGIAKTAREEKLRAKAEAKKKAEENERMARSTASTSSRSSRPSRLFRSRDSAARRRIRCRKSCTRTSSRLPPLGGEIAKRRGRRDRAFSFCMSILAVSNLRKAYGGTLAVDDLSFRLPLAKSSDCSVPTAPAKQRRST